MKLTLGKVGGGTNFFIGQKLNARSSTKEESIVIEDAIPNMMWGEYFLEAWG